MMLLSLCCLLSFMFSLFCFCVFWGDFLLLTIMSLAVSPFTTLAALFFVWKIVRYFESMIMSCFFCFSVCHICVCFLFAWKHVCLTTLISFIKLPNTRHLPIRVRVGARAFHEIFLLHHHHSSWKATFQENPRTKCILMPFFFLFCSPAPSFMKSFAFIITTHHEKRLFKRIQSRWCANDPPAATHPCRKRLRRPLVLRNRFSRVLIVLLLRGRFSLVLQSSRWCANDPPAATHPRTNKHTNTQTNTQTHDVSATSPWTPRPGMT